MVVKSMVSNSSNTVVNSMVTLMVTTSKELTRFNSVCSGFQGRSLACGP